MVRKSSSSAKDHLYEYEVFYTYVVYKGGHPDTEGAGHVYLGRDEPLNHKALMALLVDDRVRGSIAKTNCVEPSDVKIFASGVYKYE